MDENVINAIRKRRDKAMQNGQREGLTITEWEIIRDDIPKLLEEATRLEKIHIILNERPWNDILTKDPAIILVRIGEVIIGQRPPGKEKS